MAPPSARAAFFWPRFAPVILVAAVIAIYANTLHAPFIFDDAGAIVSNESIRQFSTSLQPPTDGSTATGRPVLNFSFALSYKLSGTDSWGYHAVNLLIHAGCALLLFGLVNRTLNGPVLSSRYAAVARPLALAIALLWAVHPLLTESVTCIAQRTESLCGFFFLLTLYAFTRRWFVISAIACLLGMGTKEVMVTAPLMVLLHDRTFFAGTFAAAWRARRTWYLLLASTWVLLIAVLVGGGGTRGTAAGFGLGISSWEYLLTQASALIIYLKLSLWPHPLVLDYGTEVVRSLAQVWWQGVLVLMLLGASCWALVRKPTLGFIGAWFFIILAPSSSVVPLVTQTITEHRMYLPLVAVVAVITVGAHHWLGSRKALLALGIVAPAFMIITVARNHDYRDPIAIWTDTVAKRPQSARAHLNLGIELRSQKKLAEALVCFERAVALQSDYVLGHYNLGAALLEQGQTKAALTHLSIALKFGPALPDVHLTLGNALVEAGRVDEAIAHFETSLELKPAPDIHYNLGTALRMVGRDSESISHFEAALALNPELAAAQSALITLLAKQGMQLAQADRAPEAEKNFRRIVTLDPRNFSAHANLGNTLLMQERFREAAASYETALQLQPGNVAVTQNLRVAQEAMRSK
ncbi:tetratricopeptide repeat protein [Oleiharenicola lentus]|uniref:tetratricopeptide repeat protein n=1 Tax=Oleiharenicola lentus TaxID=2508720 RepID=UPI003F67A5CE